MNKTKILLSASLLCATSMAASAGVVINELMQSNVYTIMDDINEFPDSWLELYNDGTETVDLSGYRLAVKDKFKKAYALPEGTVINAGKTLLIYCDKVGEGLHTDFRLDSGKSDVFFYSPDGTLIEQVTLKKQPAPDVAYGRVSDGAEDWGYQLTPTPGASNAGGVTEDVLGAVEFSVPGGVWKDARTIELELSLPKKAPEGTVILYTTDGSEPTVEKAQQYSAPISITANTVVRAKAVCEGAISSPSNANSYIFLGRDVQVPVISLAINEEYLYDYNIGILVDGPGGMANENWRYDWRRPLNLEYFEGTEGAESSLNQLCETRVQGGMSRTNALKSMALYANKRFGEKRFNHELWAKDKPGVTDNKSFILRDGGNDFDWAYVRDGVQQRVLGRNTDVDWQGYSPAIIFINGKYHAMMAVRERSNEDNISANYGGLEDIDMWENFEECKAGEEESLQEFTDFVLGYHSFDEWAEYINIDSFVNLMALNYWVYNTDFPMNNIVMWRRTDGVDGRWQWLVKDCDYGLGLWNQDDFIECDFNEFLHGLTGTSIGFKLYQNLMAVREFQDYYVNRLIAYQGDFLNGRTFQEYLDEILEENHGEQAISHSKWGSSWSNFDYNIEFMRSWIDRREALMGNLMKNGWGLGDPRHVTVNQGLSDQDLEKIEMTYCGVPLCNNTFDGNDYVGRTIVLAPAEGIESIKGWTVQVGNDEPVKYDSAELIYTVEDGEGDIVINAVVSGSTSISGIETTTTSIKLVNGTVYADGHIDIYDMAGRKIAAGENAVRLPSKGVYMIQNGKGNTAKVAW